MVQEQLSEAEVEELVDALRERIRRLNFSDPNYELSHQLLNKLRRLTETHVEELVYRGEGIATISKYGQMVRFEDPQDFPAGMYVLRLEQGSNTQAPNQRTRLKGMLGLYKLTRKVKTVLPTITVEYEE